ncbi:MAG TPA: aldo/keto reductase [Cyclobacteriaceae bacterium]|nr:aldo/keto reductase [Cyclobacteriaceae bacterium]
MENRHLGRSGLKVPVLSLGTGTFGGTDDFFQKWGQTGAKEASRLIDICPERGVNFFDTANVYSAGDSEKVLGKAIQGRREKIILSTKATFKMGEGPNDYGSSRSHIINASKFRRFRCPKNTLPSRTTCCCFVRTFVQLDLFEVRNEMYKLRNPRINSSKPKTIR